MINAPASRHELEVTTVHLQTHLDAALRIVCSVSQYYVAHFLNLSFNFLFHCFSCLWFVTGYSFLDVGAQKEIRKDKSGNPCGYHSLEISRSSKKLWIIAMDSLSTCHVGSSFCNLEWVRFYPVIPPTVRKYARFLWLRLCLRRKLDRWSFNQTWRTKTQHSPDAVVLRKSHKDSWQPILWNFVSSCNHTLEPGLTCALGMKYPGI